VTRVTVVRAGFDREESLVNSRGRLPAALASAGALVATLAQAGCSAARAHEAVLRDGGAIVARISAGRSMLGRDIEVRLHGPVPEAIRTGRTASCGAVAFEGLPDGMYSLRVAHDGFEGAVENIAVTRGRDAMFELKLEGQTPGAAVAPTNTTSGCALGRRLSGPLTHYTADALQHNVQGCLVIKCVVTSAGAVRGCQAVEPLARLTKPSIDALEQQRYEPPICDGKPADMDYTFRIYFRMPR